MAKAASIHVGNIQAVLIELRPEYRRTTLVACTVIMHVEGCEGYCTAEGNCLSSSSNTLISFDTASAGGCFAAAATVSLTRPSQAGTSQRSASVLALSSAIWKAGW